MKRSKRIEVLDHRPVNKDGFIDEWPEMGFVSMHSPYDPKPSVKIEDGIITELDGKKRDEFDFLDQFIADYAIRADRAEASMAIPSLEIARKIVDIHVSRKEILEIVSGITPAKMVEVINYLNVVELMMGMQKMRARKVPGNQAHITNLKDDPVQIAADAAEGALRGFSEEETTMGVARYAPFSAMALLIGSQTGRPGVLTQCSAEEATELELGIRGLTTYAETLSVYGTEKVFIDGDDTPYSKAFLNSAYASRGLKVRFTSGAGSEVLMGSSEKKSMLYLECRCLYVTKGCGSQGIQNGSVSCIGVAAGVPAGIREVMELGASGVQMGSIFVTTLECDASETFKEVYIHSKSEDVLIIESPVGMPGRAIDGEFIHSVNDGLEKPRKCSFHCIKTCDYTKSPYCIIKALYNAAKGNMKKGYAFAGSNAFLAEKISSVKEVMNTLESEFFLATHKLA